MVLRCYPKDACPPISGGTGAARGPHGPRVGVALSFGVREQLSLSRKMSASTLEGNLATRDVKVKMRRRGIPQGWCNSTLGQASLAPLYMAMPEHKNTRAPELPLVSWVALDLSWHTARPLQGVPAAEARKHQTWVRGRLGQGSEGRVCDSMQPGVFSWRGTHACHLSGPKATKEHPHLPLADCT